MRKLLLVCAALIVAVPAGAGVRYVRGGFGHGYGYGYGPAFGAWGYGYGPYFGGYSMYSHPNAGQVKLETKVKDAEVFINGAYAGTVGELKSMWLRQGTYNLEIRSPGRARYAERIYVLNGKTMRVRPELRAEQKP
jgi:hypothetical protein